MMNNQNRPVYLNLLKIRMPASAVISILHRISGVLLFLSIPFWTYLFSLSLEGEDAYQQAVSTLKHPVSLLVLLLVSWSLSHHLLAGLRFLFIDLDYGVTKTTALATAKLVLIAGIVFAILTFMVLL